MYARIHKYGTMPLNTMSTVKKRTDFVGKHSTSGDRVIIIVPKEHMDSVRNLKNPMHVIVEEIL